MKNMRELVRKIYQEGVVLYGMGERCRSACRFFEEQKFTVLEIVGRDKDSSGEICHGVPVLDIDTAIKELDRDSIILFAPDVDSKEEYELLKQHFKNVYDWHLFDWISNFVNYYIPEDISVFESEGINSILAKPFNHYYSPFISANDLKYRDKMQKNDSLKDMDLNMDGQEEFIGSLRIEEFIRLCHGKNARYYPDNNFFAGNDGIIFMNMLMKYKPSQIIEIGSGFSTALAMDVNEMYMENRMKITCIEPFPDRLKKLLRKEDDIRIEESYLQDMDLSMFDRLKKNDILFIDSSHICKPGSDVLYELFLILPRLESGVVIHVHDICTKFEYPRPWALWGLNEAYLYRAFLTGNSNYRLLFFTHMQTGRIKEKWVSSGFSYNAKEMPGGGSLWLEKL